MRTHEKYALLALKVEENLRIIKGRNIHQHQTGKIEIT
jgi:hypothetical protein